MGNPPKTLQKIWYDKLKDDGFKDIEDSKHRLKYKDSRTQSFKDQDVIKNFFLDLDYYLSTQEIKPLHRKILELYTEGIFITEISKRVDRCVRQVKYIIAHHKEIIKTARFPSN